MVVGDIAPTQTDEPLMGTSVENILSTSGCVYITIVETGSGSALPVPTPAMDILEELSFQMVRQFFATMEYCIELVLSRQSSFEFGQILLENRVETSSRLVVLIRRERIKLSNSVYTRRRLGTWRALVRLLMLNRCLRIFVPTKN